MLSNNGVARRRSRQAAVVLGTVALGLAATAMPASATSTAADSTGHSHLLSFSVQSYSAYDRVILTMDSIPGYTIGATDELIQDGSGRDVTLPNSTTYLNIELHPADSTGFTGPTRATTGDPEVAAVAAPLTDFEGYVQVAIGLAHHSSYTVTALSPTQLAIDVAH